MPVVAVRGPGLGPGTGTVLTGGGIGCVHTVKPAIRTAEGN